MADEFAGFMNGDTSRQIVVGIAKEFDPGAYELQDRMSCTPETVGEVILQICEQVDENAQVVRIGFEEYIPGHLIVARASLSKYQDQMIVDFSDQSVISIPLVGSVGFFDTGEALLEPITVTEFQGIEPILGVLWSAIHEHELSETSQHQIQAMATLIEIQKSATVPGLTQRWKMIGTVRSALKYLIKELPRDSLAWWKLAELLNKINWGETAGDFVGL